MSFIEFVLVYLLVLGCLILLEWLRRGFIAGRAPDTVSRLFDPNNKPAGYNSWWTLHGEALIAAFREVHNGEDPESVYLELYANSARNDIE